MPKLTDDRLLTDDDLVAIRDYITGWEPARDRRFLGAARLLLAHADALAARVAELEAERDMRATEAAKLFLSRNSLETGNARLRDYLETLTTAIEDAIEQLRNDVYPLGTLKAALDKVSEEGGA